MSPTRSSKSQSLLAKAKVTINSTPKTLRHAEGKKQNGKLAETKKGLGPTIKSQPSKQRKKLVLITGRTNPAGAGTECSPNYGSSSSRIIFQNIPLEKLKRVSSVDKTVSTVIPVNFGSPRSPPPQSVDLSPRSSVNGLAEGSHQAPLEGRIENQKYEQHMLSLQSPLPNEHQFALEMCLRLSAIGEWSPLREGLNVIENTPPLLNMLLAHTGFYNDCALRHQIEQTYKDAFGGVGNEKEFLHFTTFWERIGSDVRNYEENAQEIQQNYRNQKSLLLCECYPGKAAELSEIEKGIVLGIGWYSDEARDLKCCEGCCAKIEDFTSSVENELPYTKSVMMNHSTEAMEKVGDRVHAVCEIVRNFSFNIGNAGVMANNTTMLRFLLVAAHADYRSFSQIAFDIISNISKFCTPVKEDTIDVDVLSKLKCMLADFVVATFLSSNDRFKIIRTLQAIGGLILSGNQRAQLMIIKEKRFLRQLFDFLTLKADALLVAGCLECVMAVTEIGEAVCDEVVGVRGSLSVLLSFMSSPPRMGDMEIINKSASTTAMLTIRNLAKHSAKARRMLSRYQSELANIAMSEDDCTWIAAQTLHYLTDNNANKFKSDVIK